MALGFKTGGRKPGSRNRRTKELEEATEKAAADIAAALGRQAFEGDAHTFLMAVYKDMNLPIDLRVDAAKAAIRFEKPALAQMDSKSEVTVRNIVRVPEKAPDAETWQQQHAPLVATLN